MSLAVGQRHETFDVTRFAKLAKLGLVLRGVNRSEDRARCFLDYVPGLGYRYRSYEGDAGVRMFGAWKFLTPDTNIDALAETDEDFNEILSHSNRHIRRTPPDGMIMNFVIEKPPLGKRR